MNMNPEFQRNLWLEVTLHRLIGMPAVLAAIYFLVALSAGTHGDEIANTAMGLFALFAFGWGTYLAGETVTSEVKHRTWDLQRMSSISPWSMTWGKLFGSTIYPWYGALISLAVCILAGGKFSLTTYAVLILSAVLSQTVALLSSLLSISKGTGLDRSAAVAHLLIGNLAALPFYSLLRWDKTITWGGHPFESGQFALLSVAFWCLWAIIGCYRTMAHELQVANTPAVWIAFVLVAWVYLAGFPPDSAFPNSLWIFRLFLGYGLAGILTYATLLHDRKEPATFRRMLVAKAKGQWSRLATDVPTWVPTLLLTGLFGIALSVLLVVTPEGPGRNGKPDDTLLGLHGVAWLASIYLFMLRDIAIVLFFNLGKRRQRADSTALLYLAILYTLVPGILLALELKDAALLFVPFVPLRPTLSLISSLFQAALAVALVIHRWRSGFGKPQPVLPA
jgi:hypothetical protein